jgi:hypothetical protein
LKHGRLHSILGQRGKAGALTAHLKDRRVLLGSRRSFLSASLAANSEAEPNRLMATFLPRRSSAVLISGRPISWNGMKFIIPPIIVRSPPLVWR